HGIFLHASTWLRAQVRRRPAVGAEKSITLFPCVLTSQWHGRRGDTHHCWAHPGQLVFRAVGHRRFDDLPHAAPPSAVCRGFALLAFPPLPRTGIWACFGINQHPDLKTRVVWSVVASHAR